MRKLLTATLILAFVGTAAVQAEFDLKSDDRVIFFGDGAFDPLFSLAGFDHFVRVKYPDNKVEIAVMGRRKSTAEDGIKRLDDQILPMKPTVVVMCFGLDDGERQKFDQVRFDAFLEEMKLMVAKIREAGAKAVLVTPPAVEEARFRGLKNVAYAEVMDKYAEGIRGLGAELDAPVVDWHKGIAEWQASTEGASQPLTNDGVEPTALEMNILYDQLLKHWGAEPLDYQITYDWAQPESISATMGEAKIASQDEVRRTIEVKGAPAPPVLSFFGRTFGSPWPMDAWVTYSLKIENLPEGSYTLAQGGKHKVTLTPEELGPGANIAANGPFADDDQAVELLTALRRKAAQFMQYQNFCYREPPEPELVEPYNLYRNAERAMAQATQQILLRQPKQIDATVEIVKGAARTAPNKPNRTPARKPNTRARAPKRK